MNIKRFLKGVALVSCAAAVALVCAITPFAAGAPSVAPAEGVKSVYELLEARSFEHDGQTLPYRIFVPADYDAEKEYPLLVFFHGAGERGSDNGAQLFHVLQECFNRTDSPVYGAIVVAPQCPAGKQWVDTPWALGNYSVDAVPESATMKSVLALIEALGGEYSLDSGRTYLLGISMGGFAVWDICARHPELVAAAAPICGGGDPAKASVFARIPIWTYHGTADTTVPFAGTRELAAAIEEAGAKEFTYTELEGVGHGIWYNAAAEPRLIPWLFSFDTTPVIEEPSAEPSPAPAESSEEPDASSASPEPSEGSGSNTIVIICVAVIAAVVVAVVAVLLIKRR